jgi:hypothetical protein
VGAFVILFIGTVQKLSKLPHDVIEPSNSGGANALTDKGYIKIYSNATAFATLKADGSIKVWGSPDSGGANAPTDKGYIKIYSTAYS